MFIVENIIIVTF